MSFRLAAGESSPPRVVPVQVKTLALAAMLALALPASAAAARPSATSSTAAVYLTLPDGQQQLQRQPDAWFTPGTGSSRWSIAVNPAVRYQTMRGFGAAFTDSSAWLISRLPPASRQALLERLFSSTQGIGLSVMRVPIGASDFSTGAPYTYDDVAAGASDPTLARFSIAHDLSYIVPVIRQALAITPGLRLIANPWSPPAWMKTNDSLFGVAVPGGPGTLLPADYGPLADYFVKFVEAYRAAGVPIWAITPQNEPLQPTADYPGMFLTAEQEATFVHDYLRPALDAAGLRSVRIYGYDYTWLGAESYVPALVSSVGAGDLAGIAYHCYFGAPEAMGAIHDLYPRLDAIEDECSTGISALSPIQVLIRSVDNWASAVLMWNVALDPTGGPKMGSGCLNCIGVTTIDPATGAVGYTGDYYQLAQASKFVRPGAARIAATVAPETAYGNSPVAGLEAAAFRNPNGTIVVVATDSGPALTFDVRRPDGGHITYELPGQQPPHGTDNSQDAAVVTFVWRGGAVSSPARDA